MVSVEVASAGTSAWDGSPASDGALLVGLERNLDLSTHRAQQLSRALVESNDVILGMGPHHVERAEALGGAGRTYLLTSFAAGAPVSTAISDPFGGDLEQYRKTLRELEQEIRRAFDRISMSPDSLAG